MFRQPAASLHDTAPQTEETVEQFLARGGRIKRIENYPDPEGRVLHRGQHLYAGPFRPPMGVNMSGTSPKPRD